jgi:N6-adenosine-specific RNA methylase IME4
LTNEAKAYFIGMLYKNTKQKKELNLKNTHPDRHNLPINTSQKIAKEYNVSPKSVRNNEILTNVIDRIGMINQQLKTDILSGNTDINKTDIIKIGALNDRELKAILHKVEKRYNISVLIRNIERKNIKDKIINEARKKETTDNSLIDIFTTKKKYRIIYADPPYLYHFDSPVLKGAKDHYPVLKLEEIEKLPVSNIAEKNSVLFLWVPSPCIDMGLEIIKHWNFQYKSMFVWDKIKHNIGNYNSVRHEILLIATKGTCLPDTRKLYDSVVSIERSPKHSEKPKEFRELIEKLYVAGNKIELFSRNPVDKWDRWGYEA